EIHSDIGAKFDAIFWCSSALQRPAEKHEIRSQQLCALMPLYIVVAKITRPKRFLNRLKTVIHVHPQFANDRRKSCTERAQYVRQTNNNSHSHWMKAVQR